MPGSLEAQIQAWRLRFPFPPSSMLGKNTADVILQKKGFHFARHLRSPLEAPPTLNLGGERGWCRSKASVDIFRPVEVESLCQALPKRLQQVVDAEGDRIAT